MHMSRIQPPYRYAVVSRDGIWFHVHSRWQLEHAATETARACNQFKGPPLFVVPVESVRSNT